ncbi:MAG: helix-turn-helix transcriptional regulator [Victivallales bacterium]
MKRYLKSDLLQLRERDLFIRITANEPFMQAVRSLQKNLRIPGNSQHARAVLLLEELLLQLQEQSPGRVNSSSQYIRQLHSLREKIADTPYLPWDFEKEAEKLSVSYVHFRRIFRQVTGWSPGQYLLECRLRHAEKLLMTSHLRISEISNECGFEDEFHFSRIFKKHRAMSLPPARPLRDAGVTGISSGISGKRSRTQRGIPENTGAVMQQVCRLVPRMPCFRGFCRPEKARRCVF